MVANSKECRSGLKLNGCFSMSRKFLLVSSFSCGVCQEVWIILLTVFDPCLIFSLEITYHICNWIKRVQT